MSEPCEFDCTSHNQHQPPCVCTADCADHPGHCTGCLPRDAKKGHWCQRHYDRAHDNLTALPELVCELEITDDGKIRARARDGGDPTRRATKVDQLSPSPAIDLADDAIRWAAAWAEAVADQHRHAGPFTYSPAGIPNTPLNRLTDYLTAHLPTIAEAAYSREFASELRTLTRTLELATARDALTHRLKSDRCMACQQKTLTRQDGSDRVICANPDCQRVWLESEYVTLVRWTTQSEDTAAS